jgi:hypothetical protein
MPDAGAPLHYVMDKVGHDDSKTTLEIYAMVQKRMSRPLVKRAFDALLAGGDLTGSGVPAEARAKMSRQTAGRAKNRARSTARTAVVPNSGPETH